MTDRDLARLLAVCLHDAHPLIAPAIRPRTKCRWINANRTTTGIVARLDAAPADVELDDEFRDADRDRLSPLPREQHAREEIFVPGKDEPEQPRREDAGKRERQDDPHERAEPTVAVDHRGFLQIDGDRVE